MRRRHFRIFWIKEIDRILRDPGLGDTGLERFRRVIEAYLKWEIAHFLSSIELKDEIAILSYYSTFFADPREEMPVDFLRIPASTLSLKQEENPLIDRNSQDWKQLEAKINSAEEAAKEFLTGTPILTDPTEVGVSDRESKELEAFFELIQKNALAPVNLAEALNVDFYLPMDLYKGVVDELLFSSLKS